jgi:SAM-dependent methyltransferase
MKKMDLVDINNMIQRYQKRYEQYGYSPNTLGWLKGKQEVRFDVLTSLYDFNDKSVLDIGCGFGDLNNILTKKVKKYYYLGVDVCEELISVGKEKYSSLDVNFIKGDFLQLELNNKFHWAIESGIFNHKLVGLNNYDFIWSVMKKTYDIVEDGFSFDFCSDKVDYEDNHLFYASPEKILSFAYKLSRNVVLRSDYMPFEFSIFVFKNECFSKEDTLFVKYKHDRNI